VDIAWAVWLVTVAVSFGVLQWLGARKKATLSATTRRWLGIDPPKPWRQVGIALFTSAVTTFVAWFIPHITG